MRTREPTIPLWSRIFGGFLALLIINLLWNEPISTAVGGGWLPFFVFNFLPSAVALFLILRGGVKRPR